MDWLNWHSDYDRPDSSLAQRLRTVQTQIRTVLDNAPAGPVKALSVCAGQGRDLLEVLADHPRRADVKARLVELDARNTAFAAQHTAGLDVEVITITPEMAQEWLDRGGTNRKITRRRIEAMSAAILRGEWRLTGEAIKLDKDGHVRDGQNRLHAIAEAGVPVREQPAGRQRAHDYPLACGLEGSDVS